MRQLERPHVDVEELPPQAWRRVGAVAWAERAKVVPLAIVGAGRVRLGLAARERMCE